LVGTDTKFRAFCLLRRPAAGTQHGVLDEGSSYLQKPFDGEGLKATIRQVLEADAVDADGAAPAADRGGVDERARSAG
jgi:DNA-binding response OmpR family regulator